jgi:small membrane protein
MTVIKVILLVGVLVLMRLYLLAPRSSLRDRLILAPLSGLLVIAVLYPDATTWTARRLGVSRGADLLFYLGFLVVFFVLGTLRIQVREQQAEITTLVRQLGLLRAEVDEAAAAPPTRTAAVAARLPAPTTARPTDGRVDRGINGTVGA